MFEVLVQNDNTVAVVKRQRIMQNSKLLDVLQIIVPRLYDELDMSQYVARLEYLTPISHNHGFVELEIADAEYKTDYILYKLKIDTNLTSEVGNVEFAMTFINVDMDEDGTVETIVRKTDTFIMPIIPVSNWFVASDSALAALDQRIAATQQAVKAMADLQNGLVQDKLDDIVLDTDSSTIYGTSGGVKKGTGIKVSDLGDAIANDTADGMVLVNTYEEDGE